MFDEMFLALWFFSPAGVANVVPIFAAHVPGLKRFNAPLDCGASFRGKRIFGEHKTWRGLVAGIIMAILTLWAQQWLVVHVEWLRMMTDDVDYAALPTVLAGALLAVGALGGDAIESFFKRQRGIAPGSGWFPWDQTDYVIGGAIAVAPLVTLGLGHYIWLILLGLGIHVASTFIGYHMGLKERPI